MRALALLLFLGFGLLFGACAIGPHPPPAPVRQTHMALKISKLELASGLGVVLVEDPHASEIQVTMRYRVGSVDDPPDQAGIAHLVEHLMFQQTLGDRSIFAHLEDSASSFNAFTTYDATTYVARAQPSHLDELLSIEAVRLGYRCTSLTDSAFAREREVVIHELQDDDTTEVRTAISKAIYPADHPYTQPIGGSEASVGAITRAQACAFADAHYGPRNAVLVISGRVTAREAERALGKFVNRIAKRGVVAPVAVAAVAPIGKRLTIKVPLDDFGVLVTWPLPRDPAQRARVRALEPALAAVVDGAVKGRVTLTELGDDRAPVFGVHVEPSTDETEDQVMKGIERGLAELPILFTGYEGIDSFDQLTFDKYQQAAIFALYTSLEDGSDRDSRLAAAVLDGIDPNVAVANEFGRLREMTKGDMRELARSYADLKHATVVKLEPDLRMKRGRPVRLTSPIHDLGQRRNPPDPEEARRPMAASVAHDPVATTTRTLPNGLKVVLIPSTSVPTVDLRLVFASGIGDEPAGARGAASLAAYALQWDQRYFNDQILLAVAAGAVETEVGLDETAFIARGLDMHLDLMLSGVRRFVREGRYSTALANTTNALHRAARHAETETAVLRDALAAAAFGAGHPYAIATQGFGETLAPADATRFRAAHYTPDNATLVIAGRFDPALADRWIDYLFADWTGHAAPRAVTAPTPKPVSLAQVGELAQSGVILELPAVAGARAHRLVAAAMLDAIVHDVRHQLGAAYALDAGLEELRLATDYWITGSIDSARAREAIELVHARIDALHVADDATASAFVAARNRVVTRLRSVDGRASMLGAQIEIDVGLGRTPSTDRETIAAVEQLTMADMTATLADLDLARAAMFVRGPRAAIDAAYAALGRTATYLAAKPAAPAPPPTSAVTEARDTYADSLGELDYEGAITEQSAAPRRFTFTVMPGYATARVEFHGLTGPVAIGDVGYRLDATTAIGLHLGIGHFDGSYETFSGIVAVPHPLAVTPVDIGAFIQATAHDRVWGAIAVGFHRDQITEDGATRRANSVGVGVEGGVDLVRIGLHRLGAGIRVEGGLGGDAGYSSFSAGLVYRM